MKNINYFIENNVEKLNCGKPTDFLLPNEVRLVTSKLNKKAYQVYKPYPEADKVVLYVNDLPNLTLYKIECQNKLRHQDILGSLFNQGLNNNSFGDIIVDNNNYYFYILSRLENFIDTNFNKVANYNISLVKLPLNYLENYEKPFSLNTIVVPSLRLDAVLSNIIKTSRKEINDLIDNKDVIVNYEIVTKKTYLLKEGNIFSIRKYGKFKFIGVKTTTKKDHLVVEYMKYL